MRPHRQKHAFVAPVHARDYVPCRGARKGRWTAHAAPDILPGMMPPDLPRRLLAVLILFVALGSLRTDFDYHATVPGQAGVMDRLVFLGGYFTILTTCLVAAAMTAVALKGRIGAAAALALVVAMVMTGVVYHLLLARLLNPRGLHWWANQGMHTALPALVVLWWWTCAPRALSMRALSAVLAWPALYAAYALIRGAITGGYPYPFLDAGEIGWARVAVNVGGLGLAFAALGAGLVALSRRFPR